MTAVEQQAPPGELLIDPFSFFIDTASRIEGLGGVQRGNDTTYAFHTPYVPAAPGRAHFTMKFAGLAARRGTLQLWVHMLPNGPGAYARVVNSERIQLNRLQQQGGQHSVPFEAFDGVTFALHGAISDNTDAAAESLVVALDRPAPSDEAGAVIEAKTSSFGRKETRASGHLVSVLPATLLRPVSQCATSRQGKEKAAKIVLEELGWTDREPLPRWEVAYVTRVLDCYGMLAAGARGLAIQQAPGPLAPLLSQLGHEIEQVVTTGAPEGVRAIDPAAIPRDLANYDFLWSTGVAEQLGTPRAMISFVEAAMVCLRPGGLAVHLLPFDPDVTHVTEPSNDRRPFTRNDVEQVALMMISRGHQAAEVKIDCAGALRAAGQRGDPGLSRFGVVARRAPSAL